MAKKQFYATGDFKYGTRMMRAGDPVEMDAPTSRLYAALGKIVPARVVRAPAQQKAAEAAPPAPRKPRARKAKK